MDQGPYLHEFYCVIENNQQMSQFYNKFVLPIRHKKSFKRCKKLFVLRYHQVFGVYKIIILQFIS